MSLNAGHTTSIMILPKNFNTGVTTVDITSHNVIKVGTISSRIVITMSKNAGYRVSRIKAPISLNTGANVSYKYALNS